MPYYLNVHATIVPPSGCTFNGNFLSLFLKVLWVKTIVFKKNTHTDNKVTFIFLITNSLLITRSIVKRERK